MLCIVVVVVCWLLKLLGDGLWVKAQYPGSTHHNRTESIVLSYIRTVALPGYVLCSIII